MEKGYKDCDRPLYSDPTVTGFLPGHAPAIRVHNTFRQSVIILQSVKNSSNATKENFKQKRYAQCAVVTLVSAVNSISLNNHAL